MRLRLMAAAVVGGAGILCGANAQAAPVTLFDGGVVAGVVHDPDTPLRLAANMLGNDLRQVTGVQPGISARLEDCPRLCIIVTRAGSPLYSAVMADSTQAGEAPDLSLTLTLTFNFSLND